MLAVRLGELAGASAKELADTYYVALLHASGLHVERARGGAALRRRHRAPGRVLPHRHDQPGEVLAFYRAHVGAGRPPEVRGALIEDAIANAGPRARDAFAAMCEVAQRFAGWLELGASVEAALEYVFARWDGRGFPDARGDEIPLPMRLLHVARDISLFLSAAGPDDARGVIERRTEPRTSRGSRRSPCGTSTSCSPSSTRRGCGSRRSRSSRSRSSGSAGERVDAAFMAIAALTGLKSPWLREHSTAVAELAEAAAWRLGLPAASVTFVRRAALAHDLGRVGVSNAIWEKPGPLGFGEWERVRLHPHFTERAFAQSRELASIGVLAGSHHERLDGSGYHRGTRAAGARPGGADPRGRRLLRRDARVAAVQAGPRRRRCRGGAAARGERGPARRGGGRRRARGGRPPRAAATARASVGADASASSRSSSCSCAASRTRRSPNDLRISAKTVGNHVQHVYEKAGVRSRAAATLWAFEHDLVAHGIGRSPHSASRPRAQTRSTSASTCGAETAKEDDDDPGNDAGRGLRPLPGASSRQRAPRSASSTARRARPSSATPTSPTASGCCSTGTPTAGRASSPTPTCRRSCRRPGTRAGRRPRGSRGATTRSPRRAVRCRSLCKRGGLPERL